VLGEYTYFKMINRNYKEKIYFMQLIR